MYHIFKDESWHSHIIAELITGIYLNITAKIGADSKWRITILGIKLFASLHCATIKISSVTVTLQSATVVWVI